MTETNPEIGKPVLPALNIGKAPSLRHADKRDDRTQERDFEIAENQHRNDIVEKMEHQMKQINGLLFSK